MVGDADGLSVPFLTQDLESRVLKLNADRTRLIQEWAAAEQRAIEQAALVHEHREEIQSLLDRAEELGEELDRATRIMDEARALLQTTAAGMGYPNAESDLVASIEALADAAIRLQEGNQLLIAEIMAVNQHREQLTADLLAVCSSQSWQLGHALTWPARVMPRRRRRTVR